MGDQFAVGGFYLQENYQLPAGALERVFGVGGRDEDVDIRDVGGEWIGATTIESGSWDEPPPLRSGAGYRTITNHNKSGLVLEVCEGGVDILAVDLEVLDRLH